jgi:hypothetical protein
MLASETGGTGWHTMESSVWQRQWTCRKADCLMNVDDDAHTEHEIYIHSVFSYAVSHSVFVHISYLLECHVVLLFR